MANCSLLQKLSQSHFSPEVVVLPPAEDLAAEGFAAIVITAMKMTNVTNFISIFFLLLTDCFKRNRQFDIFTSDSKPFYTESDADQMQIPKPKKPNRVPEFFKCFLIYFLYSLLLYCMKELKNN